MKGDIFMKNFLFIGVLASLLFGIVVFIGSNTQSITSTHQPNAEVVINVDASWPKFYHSLTDLKTSSDIAVEGSIAAIASQTIEQNLPFTDFQFHVDKILSAPKGVISGNTIIIHQTGGPMTVNVQGTATKVLFQVGDDPLMHAGDHLVLFLHQYAPNHYFVVGGPTGRFTVQQGVVHPINSEGISLPITTSDSDFQKSVLNS
jgi:hypothetical protein